jgi:hypothetical protein
MGCYYSRLIEPRNPLALKFNAGEPSYLKCSTQVQQSHKYSRDFDIYKF